MARSGSEKPAGMGIGGDRSAAGALPTPLPEQPIYQLLSLLTGLDGFPEQAPQFPTEGMVVRLR
jgi:hypothetical protein